MTRLEGSNVPAVDVESDSDHDDASNHPDGEDDVSVHLYMPVDRVSVDSAGDSAWQNVTLEASRQSSHVDGASYVQLHYMPQQAHSRQWHVFTDSSDNSEVDEPLVDFGRAFAPTTASANSVEMSSNFLTSECSDRRLCLDAVEPTVN